MRRIARQQDCGLIDLERHFPDDPELLTDGMHFTAEGDAKLVELMLSRVENFEFGKPE